jgi:predicted PurR-regulated permease PerM
MRDPKHDGLIVGFVTLLIFVVVVGILRLADAVMVPLALASLLAFLLSPLVFRLCRWGLGNTAAVVAATIGAFAIIGTLGWIVTTQAMELAGELPKYEQNIDAKLTALKRPHAPPAFTQLANMAERMEKEMLAPEGPPAGPADRGAVSPVPVQVRPADRSHLEIIRDLAAPILGPMGTGLIVVIFMIAILLQREDLRDRFIRIVSPARLNAATTAVNDATERISRYLVMQLTINSCYGLFVGLGLFCIGIPNPILWGLLAMLMRFIPFVGPWIAAAFPLILAVAIEPGWMKFTYTAGLYMGAELVTANIIEVRFYGASTGISPLALMVAAVFWTWLWGIPGLFLCTPLTVCVLVLGRHVPGLKFLSIIIGSQPALRPAAQFYHRMLVLDHDNMEEIAERYIADHSLEEFYNEVFVPALVMAEEDRHHGELPDDRQIFIFKSSRDLIEELERRDHQQRLARDPAANDAGAFRAATAGEMTVLGLPARDEADEIVALMVRHLLRIRGVAADVCPIGSLTSTTVERIARERIAVVFVSALPPSAFAAARQTTRRYKDECPALKVVVGLWSPEASVTELEGRLVHAQPDHVTTRLRDAVDRIEHYAREAAASSSALTAKADVRPHGEGQDDAAGDELHLRGHRQ